VVCWCKEISKKYTFGIYYLGSITRDILKITECCQWVAALQKVT